jgi:hypothetical protein
VKVKHEKGQYDGVDVDIYCSTSYSTDQGKECLSWQSKLVVDQGKYVPILIESEYRNSDGTLRSDSGVLFDYPENGPRDIYELGVPKSAKVLDRSPTPELPEAMAAYQSYQDNSPQRHIAIIAYARDQTDSESYLIDGLDIFYYAGIGQRRLEEFRFRPMPEQQFKAECGDSFGSLMKWRRAGRTSQLNTWVESTVIYDGKYRYSWHRSSSEEGWSAGEKVYVPGSGYRLPMGGHVFWRDILSELGWPNSLLHSTHGRGKTSIVENDYSRENHLICVEALHTAPSKKWLYYLNPERDYICERLEIHPELSAARRPAEWIDKLGAMHVLGRGLFSVAEVLEYGRTDLGQWYPKIILMRSRWENDDGTTEERKKMITVYLDADPEFPEGILDPNNPPK